MTKQTTRLEYTNKGGHTVTLSDRKQRSTARALQSRIEAFYIFTGLLTNEKTNTTYQAFNVVKRPYFKGHHQDYTPLNIDFTTLAYHMANGTLKGLLCEDDTHFIQASIYNYCIALTLKAFNYYAGLEGSLRDNISDYDMIETIQTSYGTIIESLKTSYQITDTTDETIKALRSYFNKVIFRVFRAYTYQLQRDSHNLDIDGTITHKDGSITSLADVLVTTAVNKVRTERNLDKVISAMNESQANAMMKALSHRQQLNFAKLFVKRLNNVAHTDAERKAYGRYAKLIMTKYDKLED